MEHQYVDYLMYHFVNARYRTLYPTGLAGTRYAISRKRFAKELDVLKEMGFTPVSLREVHKWQNDPDFNLPQKPVVISFDGANREWLTDVAPELVSREMPAVFYTITGWVEQHAYPYVEAIGWEGLSELAAMTTADGRKLFEIESHSVDHRLIADAKLPAEQQIRYQLQQSKLDLDRNIGQETRFFALPDGKVIESELFSRLARETGYWGVRTSDECSLNYRDSDPYKQSCRYVAHRYKGVGWLKYVLNDKKSDFSRKINYIFQRLRFRVIRSLQG